MTVYDVLGWLAVGMSHAKILDDFPELTEEDIRGEHPTFAISKNT